VAETVVLLTLLYVVYLFGLSRRRRADLLPAPDDLVVVFTIPCLNEEAVIAGTLDSLLALPGEDHLVLVIDDASDDRTGELVRGYDDRRVQLVRRELPNARRGKGDALNAGIGFLRTSGLIAGRPREKVIVAVFDADGRIAPDALSQVGAYFRDPKAGAVQIGVEIRNAATNLLARLQDMEFTVFTEIFQRARQRLGSVGLGGNGQFVRLSALDSLGEAPWTDCLTEDLDLGVRLIMGGWKNHYCPTATVDQQAVTSIGRWLRQRSRWFQGHLQCWRLLPQLLRAPIPARSMTDMVWYLMLPVAVLLTPLVGLPVLLALAVLAVAAPHDALRLLMADHGLPLLAIYLLSFGQAYLCAFVYWMRGRVGFRRALVLAHAFELYSNLWLISGWWAVLNVARRRRRWYKTARVAEAVRPAQPTAVERAAT
jgi:cellulose synthase/poly-beta-1,6-N-acetylglucosamine synthase-like glycosyltransferase